MSPLDGYKLRYETVTAHRNKIRLRPGNRHFAAIGGDGVVSRVRAVLRARFLKSK